MFGRLGFGSKRNTEHAAPTTTGMFVGNSAASFASLPISATDNGGDGPLPSADVRPDVDPVTELAAWFVVGLPRPALKLVATNLMQVGRPGEFLIRDVKSDPSCYGLTVKLGDGKLLNKLIDPRWFAEDGPDGNPGKGFGLKGGDRAFGTLHELVYHYSQGAYPALDGIRLQVNDQFSPSIPYEKFPQPPAGYGNRDAVMNLGNLQVGGVPRPPTSQTPATIATMTDMERWALNKKLELGLATPNDVLYSRVEATTAYAEGSAYPTSPSSPTFSDAHEPPAGGGGGGDGAGRIQNAFNGLPRPAQLGIHDGSGGGGGGGNNRVARDTAAAGDPNASLMDRVNNRREAQRLRVERMARDILTAQQMADAKEDTLNGPGGNSGASYAAPSNATFQSNIAPAPNNPMMGMITALTSNTTDELRREAHQAHMDALRIEAELAEMQLDAARATVAMLRSPESQEQLLAQHRVAMTGGYASDSGPEDIYSSVNLRGKATERAAAAAGRYSGFSPFGNGANPSDGFDGGGSQHQQQHQQQGFRPALPVRRPSAEGGYGFDNNTNNNTTNNGGGAAGTRFEGGGAGAGGPASYDDDVALDLFVNSAKSPLGGALRNSAKGGTASPADGRSSSLGKKRSVGFNDEHVTVSFETSKAANKIELAAAKSEQSKAHGRSASPPPFKRGSRGVRTGMSVYNNPKRVVEQLELSTPSAQSSDGPNTSSRSRALWSKVRTQMSKLTNDESRKQMLRKEEIEALHKMELAEQSRSEKFDRQWNREVAKLDNKNSIVVQQQRAKLHQVKETEMTRRMKWEAAWVAREHRLLYGRADASEHFNEYMADMAQREGQLDALGDTRYRKASEVIGLGKVAAQTKALINASEAFQEGIRKPSRTEAYVMTWKRSKKESPMRPSIMSSMMSDDDDDEEFGFPDEE